MDPHELSHRWSCPSRAYGQPGYVAAGFPAQRKTVDVAIFERTAPGNPLRKFRLILFTCGGAQNDETITGSLWLAVPVAVIGSKKHSRVFEIVQLPPGTPI